MAAPSVDVRVTAFDHRHEVGRIPKDRLDGGRREGEGRHPIAAVYGLGLSGDDPADCRLLRRLGDGRRSNRQHYDGCEGVSAFPHRFGAPNSMRFPPCPEPVVQLPSVRPSAGANYNGYFRSCVHRQKPTGGAGARWSASGEVEAIEPRGSPREEVGFFLVAGTLHQKLAGVPKHRVAVRTLVDGKVTLKQATRTTKGLDAGLDIGAPRGGQDVGGRRFAHLVEAEAAHAHAEAAEFDVDIAACGQRLDRGKPVGKYLPVPAGISANANGSTVVIENDPGLGEGARQVGEFADLRVVKPSVEGKAEPLEYGEAVAKVLVAQEARRRIIGRAGHAGILVPGGDVADSAETVTAGADVSHQHGLHAAAQG